MFVYRNIYSYIWNCRDRKTQNQIDHILIDRRWHSNILDARSFRGAACDTDHSLVVSKVTECLAVSKETEEKFGVERVSLRKQSELEFRKEYQIKT
jgi:hypothetical protein